MSEFQKPLSFRNPPVQIEVGPLLENEQRKTITVSDMPYGKRRELMVRIAKVLFDKDTLPISLSLFEKQITAMISPTVSVSDAVEVIKEKLMKVYDTINDDQIKDLLILCTCNSKGEPQLTGEDVDAMGGDEARNLLQWLLNRSFMTEKNLHASLSSILNPKTSESTSK